MFGKIDSLQCLEENIFDLSVKDDSSNDKIEGDIVKILPSKEYIEAWMYVISKLLPTALFDEHYVIRSIACNIIACFPLVSEFFPVSIY